MKRNFIKAALALLLLTCLFFTAAIFTGAASEIPEISISQCSLSLRDSICIKYAVESNVSDVKLLVWTSPREEYVIGTEDDVITEYTIENIGGIPHKVFDYTELAAKQMADVVYTRAYAEANGKDYYSEVNKYSILQYAYNKLGKTGTATTSEELKALLTHMLEYGAAAQSYLDYNTDRPANADWYQIKVSGGLLDDGCNHGLYRPGDVITLTAPEYGTNSGVEFSHWENSAGESVSTEKVYTVTVGDKNEHYTAVTVTVPITPPEYVLPESPTVSVNPQEWLLDGVPFYVGGDPSNGIYLAGQGMDPAQSIKNENRMQIIAETNAKEFAAYLIRLEKAGYEKEFYREADKNLFASYIKGSIRVYAYFMHRTGEVRVIAEKVQNSSSVSDFSYVYEKSAGETSVLYQYSFAMTDANHPKEEGYKDNGMLYIIKLADNSVIIIDGANTIQFPDSQCENLMNMFWDITGTPRGETVKVAAWYITHAHGDHFQGFRQFTYEYSQYLDLERIAFGFPSVNSPTTALSTGSGANGYSQIASLVNAYYSDDDPIVFRLHTGQEFNLADVSFEVLYTHEDGVDAKTGVSYITNYNDASSVVRITMDGETFLILGDASIKSAQRNLLANWSGEYLKSDGIQISHHVMDNITNLYNTVKAAVVFVPQSRYNVELYSNRVAILEVAISHARSDMIFYQNEYTVGIAVVDGRWEKVYTLPVIYDLRK